MFSFLRLFARRDERAIFTYRVAGKRYHTDPLHLERKLEEHGGKDWGELVKVVADRRKPFSPAIAAAMGEAGIAERKKQFHAAVADLVAMTRKTFDLSPLNIDGTGTTDAEALSVLTEYLAFADGLAENALPLA